MEDKTSTSRSSEEELGSALGGEKQDMLAGSSSQNLAVGRRVPGFVVPTVEALIIGKKLRKDGTVDVSLLIAPFIKKGIWIRAAVYVRNEQKISKRVVEVYKYPLPWAHKLSLEAIRNKAEGGWVRDTIEDINSYVLEGVKDNQASELELLEEDVGKKKRSARHKVNLRDESSDNHEELEDREAPKLLPPSSRHLPRATRHKKWSSSSSEPPSPQRRKPQRRRKVKKKRGIWPNSPRSRRAAAKAIRSSSANSLDSSEEDGFARDEVGESGEEDDGLVDCPFTKKDIRRYINVRDVIKGNAIERRYIRQALHNLYRHYTSLQTFVDSIRAKTLSGPSQPYPSELVWLEHHAIYIDCLLFESLRGMWGQWQEPILDLLVMSFLELTVRCSPRRQYPKKLEERVRKWMKKNRIGLSSSYGVLPFYLQNAKVSERGVLVNHPQFKRGRQGPVSTRQNDFRNRGAASGPAGLDEEESNQRARMHRMNKVWEKEGLQPRRLLNCIYCKTGCPAGLPLPYAILTKFAQNRRKNYQQANKEVALNLCVLALNQLWGGRKSEVHVRNTIHWECADNSLQNVFRGLLKWDPCALKLPPCRAAYENLTKDVKVTYGAQQESGTVLHHLVEPSRIALPKVAYTIIPMLTLLPPRLREIYASPTAVIKTTEDAWIQARKIKVALRMPRWQYVKVLTQMAHLRMIE